MVDLTGYDFEIKTYFTTNRAINPNCLAILPLEPKRKLQKCKCLLIDYFLLLLLCLFFFLVQLSLVTKTLLNIGSTRRVNLRRLTRLLNPSRMKSRGLSLVDLKIKQQFSWLLARK